MNDRPTLLHVLMGGVPAGQLSRTGNRLEFTYDDDYLALADPTPVSVSLPVTAQQHQGRLVANFIDGLLPDNVDVRARWARRFDCLNRPMDLLAHVGEDCAGALQFVRPERLDDLQPGERTPVDEDQIAEWIRDLRTDPSSWLANTDEGQFSLAGMQSKFALQYDEGRWWRPTGATPTTHIIKPASTSFQEYDLDEHLSQRLAAAVGLIAARTDLVTFAGERAVVVERFDRFVVDGAWHRIHQEDLCQALGLPPERKYENLKGPDADTIARLLRDVTGRSGDDEVERFAFSLVFNWFIGGTDAHAKNYALLHAGGFVRLAPLYDLGSALPYVSTTPIRRPGEIDAQRAKMAMRIGRAYLLREVRSRDIDELARTLGLGPAFGTDVKDLGERICDDLVNVLAEPALVELGSAFPELYRVRVTNHVRNCLHALEGKPPRSWF